MAINVNRVTLVGRVGQDPEHKGTGDGFVTFSLATSQRWRDSGSGESREKTEWHNIVVFNKNAAKYARDYIRKGDEVYVEGRIESREYDGQNGERRKVYEIVVPPFEGVIQANHKSRDRGDGDSRSSGRDQDRQNYGRSSGGGSLSRDMDDDIPF